MIKTNVELATVAEQVANNYNTLYVLGAFGSPMKFALQDSYIQRLEFNQRADRQAKMASASADTFAFDCSGLVKGLLWGWNGDTSDKYGGVKYQSNGVYDLSANEIIKVCKDVSDDFSNIMIGEFVWISGHDGIYIGNGLVAECTHRWKDGVQITAVHNIGVKSGYNGRTWTKHGKLPWITYISDSNDDNNQEQNLKDGEFEVVLRVIDSKSKGDDVRAMQILLEGNGCKGAMNSALYGSSGSKTVASIEMFQRKVGLPVTGKCDEATWNKLLGR